MNEDQYLSGKLAEDFVNYRFEHIIVDDAGFSDLGSSLASDDTTFLTSSIRDHVYENGRRYHSLNAGTYLMPNDEHEQERLDMFHHTLRLMLNGELHIVRLPRKLDRILAVGAGTGIWAITMADSHPEAQVIGVDLSPIHLPWVPSNCTFEVDDIEKPWIWNEPFDFIHSGNLGQGIHDWPTYARRMFENLTPGGVVQIYESRTILQSDDNTIPIGGNIARYIECFHKGAEPAGIKDVCEDLERCLKDAGFVDVQIVVKKMPIGPWARDKKMKEIGRYGLAIMQEGLMNYGLALFTRYLEMSVEETEDICRDALNEMQRRGVHGYNAQWFVEGRKPEATANDAV